MAKITRMPPVARFRAPEGHLIVCGDDMLAFRVTQELTTRYRERVIAVLPSKRQGLGPDIDRLPGTRVIERAELTSQAFTDAQITSARRSPCCARMTWATSTRRCGPAS